MNPTDYVILPREPTESMTDHEDYVSGNWSRRNWEAILRSAESDREFRTSPPEKRPQDPHLGGRNLKFETLEHGGAEPDTMPNAIRFTDPQGRSAVYVFLRVGT